jgi:predicted nucleic acid-binding protein
VLLDTCVLLNLLATGEIESILSALNKRWLVCAAVEKESLYLRTEDPNNPLEPVSLAPLLSAKLLEICDIENADEAQLYVNYSVRLDDGEAMSVALAVARGYRLATDERKARRIFSESGAPRHLSSTSQIIKEWTEIEKISRERAKSVLLAIIQKARFLPSASDENFQWWNEVCS